MKVAQPFIRPSSLSDSSSNVPTSVRLCGVMLPGLLPSLGLSRSASESALVCPIRAGSVFVFRTRDDGSGGEPRRGWRSLTREGEAVMDLSATRDGVRDMSAGAV